MVKGDVVGEYEMPEKAGLEPCGISQCATPHRRGYLVAIGDGKVGHVGQNCGRKHFGLAWGERVKSYRRARGERAKASALLEAITSVRALIGAQPIQEDTRIARAREMLGAFDTLPSPLRDSISAKAQDGDPAIWESLERSINRLIAFFTEENIATLVKLPASQRLGIRGLRIDASFPIGFALSPHSAGLKPALPDAGL